VKSRTPRVGNASETSAAAAPERSRRDPEHARAGPEARRDHDVGAAGDRVEHRRQRVDRVRVVGVHGDDDVVRRRRRERGDEAVAQREPQPLVGLVDEQLERQSARRRAGRSRGAVAAAVVDDHHRELEAATGAGELGEAAEQARDRLALVVRGEDDPDHGRPAVRPADGALRERREVTRRVKHRRRARSSSAGRAPRRRERPLC